MNSNLSQAERGPIIHLAVADDHPLFLDGLVKALAAYNEFKIIGLVSDGDELIEALKGGLMPDICMLDASMPRMDAFDTVPILRERWPKIKILICTGYDCWKGYLVRLAAMGINGFLSKNHDWKTVVNALLTIHKNGYYFNESFTPEIVSNAQYVMKGRGEPSATEIAFLKVYAKGLNEQQMAIALKKSRKSIEGCRYRLASRLEAKNRGHLISIALQYGYIRLEDLLNPEDDIF